MPTLFRFFFIVILLVITAAEGQSQTKIYVRDWQRADSLAQKGLPKSALEIVNRIEADARKNQNYPQLVKVAMHQLIYRSYFDEIDYVTRIKALQTTIRETPFPARSILQSILAEVYWRYYQQNRWKFRNRARLENSTQASSTGDSTNADADPRTWDVQRLISTISALYQSSLAQSTLLQEIPISTYDLLLEKGDAESRLRRPTLYDFLTYRAIDFFANTEADLTKPVFEFTLDQAAYLDTPDVFARLTLQTPDSLSLRFQTLRLYQRLIALHLPDKNPLALVDADIHRLEFIYRYSTVANKDSIYRQTLRKQMERYQNQPAEADYIYALAKSLSEQTDRNQPLSSSALPNPDRWNRKQAADLCRNLIKKHPQTLAAQNARSLLEHLTKSVLTIQLEKIIDPNKAFRALVTYQNLAKVHFRTVRIPRSEGAHLTAIRSQEERQTWLKRLLLRPQITFGTITLPDDGDLNQHAVEAPMGGLPMGAYVLLISTHDSFKIDSELFSYVPLTVSRLGYLTQHSQTASNLDRLGVVDQQTGQPLANITVDLLSVTDQKEQQQARFQTDSMGFVKAPAKSLPSNTPYRYRITTRGDTLLTELQYNIRYGSGGPKPEAKKRETLLFTDRAIYRPGQTIFFKGILYEGLDRDFTVVANREADIRLLDTNGSEVAKLSLPTNEFGTFEGRFTAPTGVLTGIMTLQSENGQTFIQVEEYKRPTFEVRLDTIRQAYRLNQKISVRAQAKTFSGAAVDAANVRYRITRRQRHWALGWSRRIIDAGPDVAIANGTLTTDATGAVSFTFTATPDPMISPSQNPVFDFEIALDVTDRSGETHTLTYSLNLGYTALRAQLPIPERVNTDSNLPVPVQITNAAGKPVNAQTDILIYRLQSPTRQLRRRLWQKPDRYLVNRTDYERLFPNDIYADEDVPANWPKGEMVQQASLTGLKPNLTLQSSQFVPGEYVAVLSAQDSTGEKVSQSVYFTVNNPAAPIASSLPNTWVSAEKNSFEPGQEAVFFVGNAQPGWILMTIQRTSKSIDERWIKTDGRPHRVAIPVTEEQRGGFSVLFTMVQNGRLLTENTSVQVPFTNKRLRIETETVRKVLKPGQPEEWTLRISGPDREKVSAELAATLYDASLDTFIRHSWTRNPYERYQAGFSAWISNAFTLTRTQPLVYEPRSFYPGQSSRVYDQLSWYSYDLTGNPEQLFQARTLAQEAPRITITRQGNKISGRATNPSGQPVPGITITLKGTNQGTVTDQTGHFAFSVTNPSKSLRIIVSFVGLKSTEINLTDKKSATVRLKPDHTSLNEVVVVGYGNTLQRSVTGSVARMAAPAVAEFVQELEVATASEKPKANEEASKQPANKIEPLRRNFNETAFFLPQVRPDKQGRVTLKFTMPDALTRWRLLVFSHTKDLKTGYLEEEVMTQKELMVTANAPRFLREGDTLRITARINNLTNRNLSGNVRFELLDTKTGQPINAAFGNNLPVQTFSTQANQSAAAGWRLLVPTGYETITYRLTANAGTFTDGEEATIPVLPNRMLVTETLPFWVNGREKKAFRLDALANVSSELPVQHERLTAEVTSNPAWYALQALPYLIEYPYECAEQLFSRLYANSLAAHIIQVRPAFQQIIKDWKTKAPKNPLATNAELKAITLENTPWLREARTEAERQAKLADLFEGDQLQSDQQRTIDKLKALQTSSGGFRWFGGMQPDLTITLHLLGGFGHLQKLGVQFSETIQADLDEMLPKAVAYADAEITRWLAEQKQQKTASYAPYLPAQYLYARSFYKQPAVAQKLLAKLYPIVSKDWLKQTLQAQAMTALALHRFDQTQTASAILASLRERAKTSEELGMYWPENKAGVYWHQAPIETQAYLIEAFSEINSANSNEVDQLKRWLLRQKQTQSWSSTKATTEAIYALLIRGTDWLDQKPNTDVRLGSVSLASRTDQTEALTGYQKVSFTASEIKPEMGRVEITKKSDGPAWGALYWQHFVPMDQVAAGSAGLSVQKTLFQQKDSPAGPIISAIKPETALKPGDVVKVRLILTTDRTTEYVHLKDGRASGFEPVVALSGYKYQNSLGYYETPRDASTDFFIQYLPVGTHVFEYDLRVVHAGNFTSGVATVQCFYAPEFAAHSAGGRIDVKP
ncbi:alpha-2-macroglobulin family protein [Tellurirhabdus bombi]|uniref:alpha-2-macroglobulin family protein n=1 Tax=Tellurirhabdus bombi TaxID=2907205 RepID=UPI001F2878C1|nr:alpha-2-macroglobulin family protein [Tellurirhabdus bombi]